MGLFTLCWLAPRSYAQEELPAVTLFAGQHWLAGVNSDSPAELEQLLLKIEQLFAMESEIGEYEPVVMVLHGPEVAIFLRSNYQQNKHLVDLAARLTAFNIVDIRVCETRLADLGEPREGLVPFVDTVPFGPAEINRLLNEEHYVNF
ncbi:DsrE family protein [Halioxenophilus sp. WMMB6]|uniref:DsrE family protein n=1 Tax=Halioxenophilus sp. WMMB6 TaxID=3073815 RepID=UPI00295EF319|nr:DsrE family protein [Halioxenophilus sp. WMMB6]